MRRETSMVWNEKLRAQKEIQYAFIICFEMIFFFVPNHVAIYNELVSKLQNHKMKMVPNILQQNI